MKTLKDEKTKAISRTRDLRSKLSRFENNVISSAAEAEINKYNSDDSWSKGEAYIAILAASLLAASVGYFAHYRLRN